MPETNADRGPVQSIELDSRLLEIPVNVKYYYPVSQGRDIYFSIGLNPNLYLSQNFEYGQELNLAGQPNGFVLNSLVSSRSPEFYLGTLNTGAGVSINLRNQKTVQIGAFYQKSLKGLGLEERGMNSYGLKASYWLRLR